MPYCTQDDILEQLDSEILVQLTDDAGTGSADASVVERAIADADSEIDAYCGRRYTVPFAAVPGIIRKLSVDIAIYHLYGRRTAGDVPDGRKGRYGNAVRLLEHISKGLVTLGGQDPEGNPPSTEKPTLSADERLYGRSKMKGY